MKIVSPFHDYYDTALGHGVDPHVVWKRVPREWNGKGLPLPDVAADADSLDAELGPRLLPASRPDRWRTRKPAWHYRRGWVAFCGRTYPFIEMIDRHDAPASPPPSTFCYSTGEVAALLKKKELARFERDDRVWRFELCRADVDDFFEQSPGSAELHRVTASPVVVGTHTLTAELRRRVAHLRRVEVVTVNARLADFEFQSVVDPYTAFQELSMYLGGVLGRPEMEHAPIPDDAMRDMKGFDEQSFKQIAPGDKKRKRRANRERKRKKRRRSG